MPTETQIKVPEYFEPLTRFDGTWLGMALVVIFLLWIIALIFIPFFLWGIYSQSYKQTALLRSILEALKRKA